MQPPWEGRSGSFLGGGHAAKGAEPRYPGVLDWFPNNRGWGIFREVPRHSAEPAVGWIPHERQVRAKSRIRSGHSQSDIVLGPKAAEIVRFILSNHRNVPKVYGRKYEAADGQTENPEWP